MPSQQHSGFICIASCLFILILQGYQEALPYDTPEYLSAHFLEDENDRRLLFSVRRTLLTASNCWCK